MEKYYLPDECWESRRFELVKSITATLVDRGTFCAPQHIAERAISIADAVIEAYKGTIDYQS
jgi:hypothetical protein